jgi:hypothetical protein
MKRALGHAKMAHFQWHCVENQHEPAVAYIEGVQGTSCIGIIPAFSDSRFPTFSRRHSISRDFTRNKKVLQDQLSTAVSPGMWLFAQQ